MSPARFRRLPKYKKLAETLIQKIELGRMSIGDKMPFQPRQLAELIWTLSHRNITEFLSTVPEERWVRLSFEELVKDPTGRMKELCKGLEIPFHPAVVEPYENLAYKMTDGIYTESTPMGDPGFLAHGRIDPSAANAWTVSPTAPPLGDPTWELAASFGYGRPSGWANGSQRRPTRH